MKQGREYLEMLGQIWANTRWGVDFVWMLDILGQRQATPGWTEDPTWVRF